jgi:hypothetical protein
MSVLPALVLIALASPPEPGALADLDAVLARFTARDPLRASFTHHFETANGEGKELDRNGGEVSGEVAEDGAGLGVTWPRSLLDRARGEERRRNTDAEAKTPTRDAIKAVDAMDLAEYLDAAAALRQALEGAHLVEDRADPVDGEPARLLVLELKPVLSARDRRYVKNAEASLRVWLGADGVPLAAESHARLSGRALLVVTFKTEEHESWRFERSGDRLVAVRHEATRRGEGAGEKGERKTTTVLALARNGARD